MKFPQPNRCAQVGSFDEMPEMDEKAMKPVSAEVGTVWKNWQAGPEDVKFGSDWKADGMETKSSTSVVTELSDLLSTTQGKSMDTFGSAETPGGISLGVDAYIYLIFLKIALMMFSEETSGEKASHNLKYCDNSVRVVTQSRSELNSGGSKLTHVTTNAQPLTRNTNSRFSTGFWPKASILGPNFPENFNNEMKLGAGSICPLNFPTF